MKMEISKNKSPVTIKESFENNTKRWIVCLSSIQEVLPCVNDKNFKLIAFTKSFLIGLRTPRLKSPNYKMLS